MRHLLWLLLSACTSSEASVPGTAAAAVGVTTPAEGEKMGDNWGCGAAALAPCPLQGFMAAVLAPAAKRRDFGALEAQLQRVALWAPADFVDWRARAQSGAAAARAGDIDGVRAACGSCHDKYKGRYRREHRDRPLSGEVIR